VNVDDRQFERAIEVHRAVMEDGTLYCDLCDGLYPCEDVTLATVALRLGRIVELLEQRV